MNTRINLICLSLISLSLLCGCYDKTSDAQIKSRQEECEKAEADKLPSIRSPSYIRSLVCDTQLTAKEKP